MIKKHIKILGLYGKSRLIIANDSHMESMVMKMIIRNKVDFTSSSMLEHLNSIKSRFDEVTELMANSSNSNELTQLGREFGSLTKRMDTAILRRAMSQGSFVIRPTPSELTSKKGNKRCEYRYNGRTTLSG